MSISVRRALSLALVWGLSRLLLADSAYAGTGASVAPSVVEAAAPAFDASGTAAGDTTVAPSTSGAGAPVGVADATPSEDGSDFVWSWGAVSDISQCLADTATDDGTWLAAASAAGREYEQNQAFAVDGQICSDGKPGIIWACQNESVTCCPKGQIPTCATKPGAARCRLATGPAQCPADVNGNRPPVFSCANLGQTFCCPPGTRQGPTCDPNIPNAATCSNDAYPPPNPSLGLYGLNGDPVDPGEYNVSVAMIAVFAFETDEYLRCGADGAKDTYGFVQTGVRRVIFSVCDRKVPKVSQSQCQATVPAVCRRLIGVTAGDQYRHCLTAGKAACFKCAP